MKIFRRFASLILLVRTFRRIAVSLERLTLLYEADLRERGIILPDPKLAGTKEAEVEISYGPTPVAAGEQDDRYQLRDFADREPFGFHNI